MPGSDHLDIPGPQKLLTGLQGLGKAVLQYASVTIHCGAEQLCFMTGC